MKLWERQGDKATQKFNVKVGRLIDFHIRDFDNMDNEEVTSFRRSILEVCQAAIEKREQGGKRALENYAYPPDVGKLQRLFLHVSLSSLHQAMT